MRALSCPAALFLAASLTPAADLPKPTTAYVTVSVAGVTVKDGVAQSKEATPVAIQVEVPVEQVVNGKKVTVYKKELKYDVITRTREWKLKDVQATGTDGKAIASDDLEKRLKAGGAVVYVQNPLNDDVRKAFKDGTVFIDESATVILPPAKKDK